MSLTISVISSGSLRSADRPDLFISRTVVLPWPNTAFAVVGPSTWTGSIRSFPVHSRTALAKPRAFVVVGPSTWNGLRPSLRAELVTGFSPSVFQSLKSFLCPLGLWVK